MKNESNFTVYTVTKITEAMPTYCHWADGLSMYIKKDGFVLILNSDEIRQLVKALPRTMGGSY